MTAQVMTTEQIRANRAVAPRNVEVGMTNSDSFELAQRAGKLLASSALVPPDYQNNVANCVIALNMANRIGADPLMVMQNLVLVHKRPTWSSQFLIATFNACGRFSAIRYEFFGEKGTDSWGCRAYTTELATGEKIEGSDITIALAKSEGWYNKNGSKWKTMPQQMLMYRAASWLVRAYAPELAMGLHTAEEVHDSHMVDVTPPTEQQAQAEEIADKAEKTVETIRKTRKPKAEPVTVDAQPDEQPQLNEADTQAVDSQALLDDLLARVASGKTETEVNALLRYSHNLDTGQVTTLRTAIDKRLVALKNPETAKQPNVKSLKARMEECDNLDDLNVLSSEIDTLDPQIRPAMWHVYDYCKAGLEG